MKILVSGASGHLGHLIIRNLLERGVSKEQIVAGARHTNRAGDLEAQGIKVIPFDYDQPATLEAGLKGITHFMMISVSQNDTPVHQHDLVIEAAAKANLEVLVFTSIFRAKESDLPLAPIMKAAEEKIEALGIPHVFLRDNAYLEMYLSNVMQAIQTGQLVSSAGDAKIAGVSRFDIAEAAAIVLTHPEYYGQTLELAGDQAFTFKDLAQLAQTYRKTPVTYQPITLAQSHQMMKQAGFPKHDLAVMDQLEKVTASGALYTDDHTLSEILGHATLTIDDLVKRYLMS
ncbi:NmrA family NAD(P)-binding protein [Lactobacillus alvi]|uniref:NmrA family NAD(P)-binding protein n=1 Tax=Limosilactobacillus alvi TaxID=990412 RepID=A0ABS2EM75_9LACO|nr:NmrA family NAD(P)-binding protein [Limosilactobacillus alvi]MBM6753612.1 NmrA family NAD(P)-binding protein [Limosilactobacillus alvi]